LGTLQRYVGSPFVDKTNLTGLFDLALRFSQEGLVNPDGMPLSSPAGVISARGVIPGIDTADPVPTLFVAIQELGLKLEPAKGPVEVLAVDSVQKPTEN
jgi:uncharacterized protein (TIGR03435 family)